jgi:hypothetical protein
MKTLLGSETEWQFNTLIDTPQKGGPLELLGISCSGLGLVVGLAEDAPEHVLRPCDVAKQQARKADLDQNANSVLGLGCPMCACHLVLADGADDGEHVPRQQEDDDEVMQMNPINLGTEAEVFYV